MKFFNSFIIILFCINLSFAQEIESCRKVISITTDAINTQSMNKLSEHLSDNFTISGQTGAIAKLVLNQLISQLGETVISYNETSRLTTDNSLILSYIINYKTRGEKEAKFIFNENNQLTDLSLFKMKVKKLQNVSELQHSVEKCISAPFKKYRNLIIVEANYNGKAYNFMLDSGSPRLIINSKTDTIPRTISSSKDVNGNISNMDIVKIDNFSFAGVKMKNQDALVMNLSHLEKEIGTEIKGLIGYEIIKNRDILFDYQNNTVHFLDPDFSEQYIEENFQQFSCSSIHFILNKHIPVLLSKIGKNNYFLGIDCGAETNLMDDDLYNELKKYTKNVSRDTLIGIEKNSKIVKHGKIKKMKIDNETFKNMSTVFSDISHLSEKLQIHGIIGYEFLSKQLTLISYKNKKIILIKE